MKTQKRTQNSLRNSIIGVLSQVALVLLGLYTRKVFLVYLDENYLGLNGVFSNVISILSLTELGFSTAAIYALYKPLAEENEPKISALMNVYKKIYDIMFLVVAVFGVALMPFIKYIIKDMPDNIPHIYWIYLLFVLDSALSYLFSYKRSLLFADQKNYKITLVTTVAKVLLSGIQIVGLMLTGNYYVYLIAMIAVNFLTNVVISMIVSREYPYLKKYRKEKIDQATKDKLISDTKALLIHKIGSIAVYQTDNIITSAFVSLAAAGLYSNYTMITNSVQGLTNNIVDGSKASIGNFNACEGPDAKMRFFRKFDLFLHILNTFCTVSMFCLFNHFIGWMYGQQYLFSTPIVLLICISFYLRGMRSSFNTIKETCGIFRPDRYKALAEAAANIVLSIALVKVIGFAGVVLGTILTTVCVCYTIEVYVTCKYAFHSKVWFYYKMLGKNLVLFTIAMAATYGICMLFPSVGFGWLVIKACVCLVVPNAINFAVYWKTEEFVYYRNLVSVLWNKLPIVRRKRGASES